MTRLIHRAIVFCCLFLITLTSTLTFATTAPVDNTIAPIVEKVLPAAVNIRAQIKITDFATLQALQKQRGTKSADADDQPLPTTYTSVGSGVIVDANNGYILTNAHVVNDAQHILVTLEDGRHYTAKAIGMDKPSDIALLQIKAKKLTAATLGDSTKLKVGDFVAAIGNPFGLSQSVSSGIVSALGRSTLGIENYENFIQTNAPINPGNSGGALINMQGEVIGINTAILAPDRGNIGIGFAIPSNMAKSVMEQLLHYGDVKRGALGIGAQDLTPELASAFNLEDVQGAAITQILPSSPAQQAGLQVGDIIVGINGNKVKKASDVVNTVAFLRVDSKITIDLLRNHKKITVTASLLDPKLRKIALEKLDPFLYGVGLKDFTVLSPIYGNVAGVVVVAVEQDSKAWNSDLRPGDVITSINQQKVSTVQALKDAVAKSKDSILLNVLRGPQAIFLVLSKDE